MAKILRDATAGVGKVAADTAGRATKAATQTGSAAKKTGSAAAKKTGSAGKKAGSSAKKNAPPTPTGLLQQSVQNLAGTLAERAVSGLSNQVSKTAGRLNEYAEGGGGNLLSALTGVQKLAEGGSPFQAAMSMGKSKIGHTLREGFETAKESLTGGGKGKGGGKKIKLTNIVEHIDVGVPIDLAYDQWTQFADFPKFTKKLEQVEQVADEKLSWTGKVFWSRRTWESTILEQVPFERIIWRSKGHKGYIDGAVTFHELVPGYTRILVVLEYHPKGFFEKTANMWRAAGRRCRLELKHFERHVMTEAVLHPDDVVGWHGEIRDSEVVKDDETARREEEEEKSEEGQETEQEPDEEPDEEEEDKADEQETDERDEDEQDEDRRPRRRPAARRRSTATRRSREKRGANA